MTDPRMVIPAEAEPFAEQLDLLIDSAREVGISDAGIAVALEDRAAQERRRIEEAGR